MFRRIFVYYHRGVQTGGPEALHQLVSTLRELGQEACLVPIPGTESNARHSAYDHYGAPEVQYVDDSDDCAVVVPEAAFSLLKKVKHATKICWWLSIDFSEHFYSERRLLTLPPTRGVNDLKRLKHRVLKSVWTVRRSLTDYGDVTHLTQSQYAWSFLFARLGIVSSMLSDFTPQADFVTQAAGGSDRGRTVAYNPAKGGYWAVRIAQRCPDIEFRAIRNMSRDEVVETLSSSAVYLDMGHHPGKDRLPREAALSGAVAVVARCGSGAFWGDVPIPWEHKVSMTSPVENAIAVLHRVLADREEARAKQSGYVAAIRAEEERFVAECNAVFVLGELEFGVEGPPSQEVKTHP